MTGALSAVRAEVAAGAGTVAEVARRTGLGDDLVRLALEQLRALGALEPVALEAGCPDGGCGGCPSSSSGCPTGGAGARRSGPVALALTARPAF